MIGRFWIGRVECMRELFSGGAPELSRRWTFVIQQSQTEIAIGGLAMGRAQMIDRKPSILFPINGLGAAHARGPRRWSQAASEAKSGTFLTITKEPIRHDGKGSTAYTESK